MPPKKTIGELYVKKTQLQHILDIPDTYIGSIEPDNYELYLLNNDNRMEKRMVSFIPGLFKIYDEIIVNAFDQYTRLNIEYNNGDHTIKPVKKIDTNTKEKLVRLAKKHGIKVSLKGVSRTKEQIYKSLLRKKLI